jgi:hypothetical protein
MKTLLCCAAATLLCGACDASKSSKVDELVSAASPPSADPVPAEPEKKKWDTVPELTVDDLGAYLGGERANLNEKGGLEKLQDIVSRLPIKDKEVELLANKKAKTRDVVVTVYELGKGGANAVVIKTDGRDSLPTQIRVVPESRLGSEPAACSAAVMVTEDRDTGVWAWKSNGGTKFRPGFAGPDLSGTEEALKKAIDRCDSDVAFFSAAHKNVWEHAYNLGALAVKLDGDKKIKKLVLLADEPVAGRPVSLKK